MAAPAINNSLQHKFYPGEHVEIIGSDLADVHCIVKSVESDPATVEPQIEGLSNTLNFSVKQLRKRFQQGDHVKVINGKFSGETGLILKITDNIVTLLSDLNFQEVKFIKKF